MAATTTTAATLPLPAWANAENRRLQRRIEQATAALKDASSRQADDDARAAAMREAVRQLDLQLRGCTAGGEAQRAEAATEDNLRRMLDQNDVRDAAASHQAVVANDAVQMILHHCCRAVGPERRRGARHTGGCGNGGPSSDNLSPAPHTDHDDTGHDTYICCGCEHLDVWFTARSSSSHCHATP